MSEIITELPPDLDLSIQFYIKSLEKFGITHVGHGIIIKGLTPTATYSHHEWARKYKDEKLYEIDPLRRYAIQTPFEIIRWENISTLNKEEAHTFEERKKICSVSKGVLISLKSSNCLETFVFGSNYTQFDFLKVYQENQSGFIHIMEEMGKLHKAANQLLDNSHRVSKR